MAGFFSQLTADKEEGEFSFSKMIRDFGKPKSDKPKILGKDALFMEGQGDETFRPQVDQTLDVMLGLIDEGKAYSLQGAYDLVQSDYDKSSSADYEPRKLASFGLYAGRALKYINELQTSPMIKNLKEQGLGLPVTLEELKGYGVVERTARGFRRDASQVVHGSVSVAQTFSEVPEAFDFWVAGGTPDYSGNTFGVKAKEILKDQVAQIDEHELMWKSYNATEDKTKPGGLALPFNTGGGIGESLLAFKVGMGATQYKSLAQQTTVAARNNTGYEALRATEHESVIEAGVGIASGFTPYLKDVPYLNKLPFLGQNEGGKAVGNLIDFANTSRRRKAINNMGLNEADRALNGLDIINGQGGVVMPYNILYRTNITESALKKTDKHGRYIEMDRQRLVNSQMLVDDYMTTSYKMLGDSLDMIGPSSKTLDVPNDWKHAPTAWAIKDYFDSVTKQFKKLAEPYKKAYREQGDNVRITFADLMGGAKEYMNERSAISHLNAAYKTVMMQGDQSLNKKLNALTTKKQTLLNKRNKNIDREVDLDTKLVTQKIKLKELKANDKTAPSTLLAQEDLVRKTNRDLKAIKKENADSIAAENSYDFQIKQINNDETFIDMDAELTFNQADDLIKELNSEIAGSSAMLGGMKVKTKTQLTMFKKKLQARLEEAPEAVSTPYKKSNELYAANFKMLDKDSAGSINGLEDALEDGTGEKLLELFQGEDGLRNLKKLGKWMPSDSPLYGTLVRTNLEGRIPVGVTGINSSTNLNTFDGGKLSSAFAGVNFDEYRALLPTDSVGYQGINQFTGVIGVSDLVGSNMNNINKLITAGRVDDSVYKVNWKKSFTDNTLNTLGLPSAFPANKVNGQEILTSNPSLIQKGMSLFEKQRAPDTAKLVYEGPTIEAAQMQKVLKQNRKSQTGSSEVVPTNQSVDGLILLDTPTPIQGVE